MRSNLFGLALILIAGCSGPEMPSEFIDGFNPKPLQQGYTRFVTPVIKGIQPGQDLIWCQWVAPAAEMDQDVLSVVGEQSRSGHHAVLYATSKTRVPLGESHICTEDDMLSLSFLGAIGGEGMSTDITGLPAGLNFRLKQGLALMANVHFINPSTKVLDGQAVIDVKFTPPTPDRMVADLFANNGDTFAVEPGQMATYDVNCVLQQDMKFAMLTNHMHSKGASAMSEIIHADGTREETVRDDKWAPDQEFNPRWAVFSAKSPKVAKKGDTYHTHCSWFNSTQKPLSFPAEMCVGTGFYFPGNGSVLCSDGGWSGR